MEDFSDSFDDPIDDIEKINKIDTEWLEVLREKKPHSTWRTFKSSIGVSPNVLEKIYNEYIPMKYPKWHLLLFYNFLRVYLVEDCGHANWNCSKGTYRKIIKTVSGFLRKLHYIRFSSIKNMNHIKWFNPQENRVYLIVGVIDTFEAFLEKDNVSGYWIRHRYISIKKGSKATFKYEVVVHPLTGRILWFSGPYFGREHDSSICRKSGILKHIEVNDASCFEKIVLLGDLAYKGKSEGLERIITKNDHKNDSVLKKLLNDHRNSVERVIGFLRRFDILNKSFRHKREKHNIWCDIVVQTCNLDIILNKTFDKSWNHE